MLAIYATVAITAGLVISLFTHIHAGPSPHWTVFVLLPLALCFGPLAVVIVSRQPRNAIGWLLLYFACTAGSSLVLGYLAQSMLADGVSGGVWLAWLTSWMVNPAFGIAVPAAASSSSRTVARQRPASARC